MQFPLRSFHSPARHFGHSFGQSCHVRQVRHKQGQRGHAVAKHNIWPGDGADTGNAVIKDGSYVKDPGRGIPVELWNKIVAWADEQGYSRKSGDYKKANKPSMTR